MYSYEIKQLLETKQYLISIQDYIEIIRSPQVDHITFKDEHFHIWTNDGYSFKLKIKKQ